MHAEKKPHYKPTIILAGGYGHTKDNLHRDLYNKYETSLKDVLTGTKNLLDSGGSAVDAAVSAIAHLEDDELFNAGRGSVLAQDGSIQMQASIAVTSVESSLHTSVALGDYVAVSLVQNIKNPIKLCRELLRDSTSNSRRLHLSGSKADTIGKDLGLDIRDADYFKTDYRRKEFQHGLLGLSGEHIPKPLVKGAVACVCLDMEGRIAVACSSGGSANKVSGEIESTATIGAGILAESWSELVDTTKVMRYENGPRTGRSTGELDSLFTNSNLGRFWSASLFRSCFPSFQALMLSYDRHAYDPLSSTDHNTSNKLPGRYRKRAVALAAIGDSDIIARATVTKACANMARFSSGNMLLQDAVTRVVGPAGELQRGASGGKSSAGVIWIELSRDYQEQTSLRVGDDYNTDGFWRAAYNGSQPVVRVFR
ncbi:L-asparaginase [Paraphoma chrysanthemicola]|nr:L-asparaginase [Paraphoma chrysanthemicola]